MSEEEKSKRRVELMKKRLIEGLTLTEAHELATLENLDGLIPWKNCKTHSQLYLYAAKCPNCFE